jgi:hypothetical protein
MSHPNFDTERYREPHAEATLARIIWGHEYGPQSLSAMDWWDSLPERRKELVRMALNEIAGRPREQR